ncbi:MAG: hypothetical protein ACI4WH_08150 [Oscillospiraceae bacterium]
MKARIIDLTEKFTTEKPVLKIGEKEYQVDNSTENVLSLNKIDTSTSEADYILEYLNKTLGEETVREINILKYPFGVLMELFYAVTSAITEEDIETIRTRFQKSKE